MKKIIFLLVISVFLITGCSVKKAEEVTDAEIFAAEYAINKKNVFKYADFDKVLEILNHGTGIIFFGNSDREDSLEAIKIFSELADKNKILEVYYYDPSSIAQKDVEKYQALFDLLNRDREVELGEDSEKIIKVPSVYFVKDGVVIGYIDNFSKIENDGEDTNGSLEGVEDRLLELIEKYHEDDIQ